MRLKPPENGSSVAIGDDELRQVAAKAVEGGVGIFLGDCEGRICGCMGGRCVFQFCPNKLHL